MKDESGKKKAKVKGEEYTREIKECAPLPDFASDRSAGVNFGVEVFPIYFGEKLS